MKKYFSITICVTISLFFCSNLLVHAQQKVEKYSKLKIVVQNRSDIKELQRMGISLEGMKLEENSVELILNVGVIMKLDELGFSYQILIDDMTKYYQERSKRTDIETKNIEGKMKKESRTSGFGFGSMSGFYTFNEIIAQLDTMRLFYPNLITEKDSIGSSIEGRAIWAIKISDNPEINESEPQLFYNSLVHGREPAGMMSVIYFMYYLLENYGSDPEVTYLVDNREFYFVPVINPDGYVYNQQTNPNGGGMWRKNRRDTGGGLFGVDICRNYDYMWGLNNIGSTPNNSDGDEMFRGTAPFSEPETQAIRDFCAEHNFQICANFHSYWDIVYAPWGYNLEQTPDSLILNNTIWLATQLNNYGNWINDPDIYERNGDHLDWMYGEQITKPKIFAYLPEVGNDNDGFWPIPERIFPLAEENCYLNKVLAWGPGVIDNPPYILVAALNLKYCRPLIDTLKISAVETNPDNHSSNVFAKLVSLNDSLLNEFKLDQIDSSFIGSLVVNSTGENFYRIILEQRGIDIPSKLIYNNLRFTTAGPVTLDSISYRKGLLNYHSVRPFVHNWGTVKTITNASLRITCNNPWIASIGQGSAAMPNIAPNSSVGLSSWITIGTVDSIFPGYFNLKVEVMSDGWTYWVDSIKVTTGVEEDVVMPSAFKLEQNFPNPFNPSTKISWQLPFRSQVTLKVYDVLGREVVILMNEEKEAGYHSIDFNGSVLPSGVYFYRMQAVPSSSSGQVFIDTKKMILLK